MRTRQRQPSQLFDPIEEMARVSSVPRHIAIQEPGYQKYFMTGHAETEMQGLHMRRYRLLQVMRRMADTDPRVNRILYKLSADASDKTFTVLVEDGPGKRARTEAQGVLDRCRYLVNDREHLRGWIEALLRDGDLFIQLMVTPEREIERAKKLAPEMTFSRMDAKGNFPENKKPYYQAKSFFDNQIVAEFEEWEIVHAKWRSEDGKPYGSPLFLAGQKTSKRIDSGEDDMALRRRLRSGLRYLINVGNADNPETWSAVDAFIERNKDTFENPINAITNIFGNGLVDIKPLEGDTQLGNKEDIDHFEGLLSMIGLTPSALISGGREKATNLNVVDAEEEDYSRTIMGICEAAEFGFVRPILNTQLLLSNINPDSIDYSINWGAKGRESDYRKFQKAALWIRLGFSHKTAYTLADIDNGLSYEEELARIEEQKERGLIPYTGPNLSRSNLDVPVESAQQSELNEGESNEIWINETVYGDGREDGEGS